MRQIYLKKLTLRNWRGEKERTTHFYWEGCTTISGGNGLGKSRHFDAFCWLLFGKDSKERKDYNLRSWDARHRELHHCECSVEAVISVDGQDYRLKREYKEQWVKPRGQVEEVFKGNVTECTWDGVPVRVGDFQKRVCETIIDDTVFKMITNPRYFLEQMKWQQQRETLLLMAGAKSDTEIAADDEDFKALLDELSGKSLSDLRKELAAEKKRLKKEADEIQPRIDEVQRNTPESEDWDGIKNEELRIKNEIDDNDRQLQDRDARSEAQRKERDNINKAIDEARARQRAIVRQADNEEIARCDKANEYRRGLEASLKKVHAELSEANTDFKRNEERIKYLQNAIAQTGIFLDDLRKKWYEINASAYDESSDICPTCGQRMPEERIKAAHDKFTENKRALLAQNNSEGRQLSEQMKSLKKELEEKQAEAELLKSNIETAENGVKTFTDAVLATPAATVKPIVAEDIPEWVEERRNIDRLMTQLGELKGKGDMDDDTLFLKENKKNLQNELDGLQWLMSKREQIEKADARIAELKERGRYLAQQIADIEKREYVAAQFTKKKIEDCEGRINAIFRTVRWQLFDQTQDGNEYETCVALVNGVPYGVANTASQINAGLDIIDALCRHYDVCAPIFIDNAESVNDIADTEAQMVLLKVTDDERLIVKSE